VRGASFFKHPWPPVRGRGPLNLLAVVQLPALRASDRAFRDNTYAYMQVHVRYSQKDLELGIVYVISTRSELLSMVEQGSCDKSRVQIPAQILSRHFLSCEAIPHKLIAILPTILDVVVFIPRNFEHLPPVDQRTWVLCSDFPISPSLVVPRATASSPDTVDISDYSMVGSRGALTFA
jgi:hypothetical protein